MTKTTWGGKGLFYLAVVVQHEGNSGQLLKSETQKQNLKQNPRKNSAHWVAPHGVFNIFSYTIQEHRLMGSIALSGLGQLTPIIYQEYAPHAYL